MTTLDPLWEKSILSTVDSMARPLMTSGWQVRVLDCDPVAKHVSVALEAAADCDACVMTDEDFAGLLEEALSHRVKGVSVDVNGTPAAGP